AVDAGRIHALREEADAAGGVGAGVAGEEDGGAGLLHGDVPGVNRGVGGAEGAEHGGGHAVGGGVVDDGDEDGGGLARGEADAGAGLQGAGGGVGQDGAGFGGGGAGLAVDGVGEWVGDDRGAQFAAHAADHVDGPGFGRGRSGWHRAERGGGGGGGLDGG